MPDPSIARFRRVISSAYASLEARRQEVNDLNVFPVADGDTGDNMAMTLRAVMEELDRLDGAELDEVGRTELVQALARAALMGARGNSGVILSQIVRGAAEELASRPGELVDPVLVAAAFASAADAAYDSVREPAEGTMLTVFREMAHSLARQLAHLEADKQRLGRDVTEAEQDAVLAAVLERAIEDGERAVARTPEQLEVLRESGVVDAGGHGLVLILAGVVAGLRGDGAEPPEVPHHEAPRLTQPHHEDSRYRYCTNFIVSGSGLSDRDFLPRLEGLGDSVLVVGDDATLKVHVHTDTPEAAVALFDGVGAVDQPRRRRHARADGRAQRPARRRPARTGAIAVAAGAGLERLFAELGAHVVPGGETLNPSTYGAAGRDPRGRRRGSPGPAELLERGDGRRARLRALREAGPGGAGDLAAGEPAGPGRARPRARRRRRTPSGWRRRSPTSPPAASPRPPATTPRAASSKGDAVGFAGGEIVAWGGAGSTLTGDDPAPRRGGRDRHRDRRRGGPDRARGDRHPRPRRGRGRDARGGPAELVVAARGAVEPGRAATARR